MAELIIERVYFPRRGYGEIQKLRTAFEWSLIRGRLTRTGSTGTVIAVGQHATQSGAVEAMRRHAVQLGWAKAEVRRG